MTSELATRDVEAVAGSRRSPFSMEVQKLYRFRFHRLFDLKSWRKSFVHCPMWIKRWSYIV